MERLFIDESGSMTATYCDADPYFIISIIRATEPDKLRRVHKRFVSSHMKELKASDKRGEMFDGNKFKEIKGSCLSPELKKKFVNYFCRNNYFELFYVIADNAKISARDNGKLYNNTARAFNYLMKLSLEYFIKNGYLGNGHLDIQLDERNEKTKAKYFLENYLNTELYLGDILTEECNVTYYDSSNNKIIQIADVFANFMYSQLRTGAYSSEQKYMEDNGYIPYIFRFPLG